MFINLYIIYLIHLKLTQFLSYFESIISDIDDI